MANKPRSAQDSTSHLPLASTAALRGRQSVRATFRLTTGCISAISIVATHLGIKQKSLFDHLVEDEHLLNAIAREISQVRSNPSDRVQKTFVISRRSLLSLEQISKSTNTPRDALVELSVQRLLPVIEKERQRHELRKKFLKKIYNQYADSQALFEKMQTTLGRDDPFIDHFSDILSAQNHVFAQLKDFVDRGRIIEAFDPTQFSNRPKTDDT